MKITTRAEVIAMRAAEILAESLAELGPDPVDHYLRMALLKARQEIGWQETRNPVAMVSPLRALVNGKAVQL